MIWRVLSLARGLPSATRNFGIDRPTDGLFVKVRCRQQREARPSQRKCQLLRFTTIHTAFRRNGVICTIDGPCAAVEMPGAASTIGVNYSVSDHECKSWKNQNSSSTQPCSPSSSSSSSPSPISPMDSAFPSSRLEAVTFCLVLALDGRRPAGVSSAGWNSVATSESCHASLRVATSSRKCAIEK